MMQVPRRASPFRGTFPQNRMENVVKKILLIGTGGTIASVHTPKGLVPVTDPEQLLECIPQAKALCRIEVCPLYNIDSTNIQPEYWGTIAKEIRRRYHEYDGFVITHGTDTMAYTAAALSYLIQNADKPIIITGAQKPICDSSTDAKKNLLDSLRFAIKQGVSGVYIVFDGQAILGTRARKVRSKSYNAFESINYPVAAFLDEHRILYYQQQQHKQKQVTFYDRLNPKVFLLKLIPGMEPDILHYVSEHYDAIVIECYGVGGVPFQNQRNFLKELQVITRAGKTVVIATQVMLEGSDAAVYEVGFQAVNQYNVLQTYDMTVEAAVVKLMWILGQTQRFDEIKTLFYQNIYEDILTCAVLSKDCNLDFQDNSFKQ